MNNNSPNTIQQGIPESLIHIGLLFGKWAQALAHPDDPKVSQAAPVDLHKAVKLSMAENPWFTNQSITAALNGLAYMLRGDAVDEWSGRYHHLPKRYTGKKVGIIAAGNIPMVAFHDILSTWVAGHHAMVKLSAQDQRLLPVLFKLLSDEVAGLHFDITWVEGRMPELEAVIATGSNNTSRYFEYYFGKYPHVIRKNRNSVAILTGREDEAALQNLGNDIFTYFGLGCRNISKLYLHDDFEIDRFFKAIYHHQDIVNHHKYANNYDYYKALWLMNQEQLLDNGFLLLRPSEAIASPPGVLYYERFSDEDALRAMLKAKQDELQCVVSLQDVPFGKSQEPELWDYADGVDTMDFLLTL